MSKTKFLVALTALFSSTFAYSQYYKTLPQGVRMFVYRHVDASNVGSDYNHTRSEAPYAFKLEADATALADALPGAAAQINNFGLNGLSAGTFEIDARGDVKVDGYGFAYGITNKLTMYTSLPIYKAKVGLDFKKTKNDNFAEIAGNLNDTGSSQNQTIAGILNGITGMIDGPMIQSIVVNTFEYEKLGHWNGQGLGDMEVGFMYNLKDESTWGLLGSAGVVLPTGRVDDPNIIQDIGFGDGQADIFAEFGGGYYLRNNIVLNAYARYTYQFAADKDLRVPYSEDVHFSAETGTFNEKLGNKIDLAFQTDYTLNDWFSVTGSYLYNHTGQAQYDSKYGEANSWLAQHTESSQHNLRLDATLSSITPFLKKNFILPAQVRVSYQTMIAGMNTPKVDRIEFEFRMMF